MPQRLYLGRLSADATTKDIEKLFANYGRMQECRVMTGFGFVEFDNAKDAEDVLNEFNGKEFLGQPMIVEFARERDSRRERPPRRETDRRGPAPGGRRGGFRVIISGISRETSWQDLKDFGREAGNVTFADVDRDYPGQGVLEYVTQDDADYAVRKLDGRELRGVSVHVDADRGGNWRESGRDRERDRDRDDRRDDRYRDRSPRRDDRRRSRSPRRRDDRDDRDRRDRDRDTRRDDYPRARDDKDAREPREPRDERDAPRDSRY
ncbi:hypothetical protein DL93DRAFT_2162277 [Clavulina sp. PMI_390]|nr:hypothetical protein DL93DRAFT_2162277 [Clavulina sp. PMI_390]